MKIKKSIVQYFSVTLVVSCLSTTLLAQPHPRLTTIQEESKLDELLAYMEKDDLGQATILVEDNPELLSDARQIIERAFALNNRASHSVLHALNMQIKDAVKSKKEVSLSFEEIALLRIYIGFVAGNMELVNQAHAFLMESDDWETSSIAGLTLADIARKFQFVQLLGSGILVSRSKVANSASVSSMTSTDEKSISSIDYGAHTSSSLSSSPSSLSVARTTGSSASTATTTSSAAIAPNASLTGTAFWALKHAVTVIWAYGQRALCCKKKQS